MSRTAHITLTLLLFSLLQSCTCFAPKKSIPTEITESQIYNYSEGDYQIRLIEMPYIAQASAYTTFNKLLKDSSLNLLVGEPENHFQEALLAQSHGLFPSWEFCLKDISQLQQLSLDRQFTFKELFSPLDWLYNRGKHVFYESRSFMQWSKEKKSRWQQRGLKKLHHIHRLRKKEPSRLDASLAEAYCAFALEQAKVKKKVNLICFPSEFTALQSILHKKFSVSPTTKKVTTLPEEISATQRNIPLLLSYSQDKGFSNLSLLGGLWKKQIKGENKSTELGNGWLGAYSRGGNFMHLNAPLHIFSRNKIDKASHTKILGGWIYSCDRQEEQWNHNFLSGFFVQQHQKQFHSLSLVWSLLYLREHNQNFSKTSLLSGILSNHLHSADRFIFTLLPAFGEYPLFYGRFCQQKKTKIRTLLFIPLSLQQ